MVTLCRTAQNKGTSWPDSHDKAIQEVADSLEHPDWLVVLANRYIRDRPEGPLERYSRPYRLQQVAWHNQSKAGADLIMDVSGLSRHLPEGFSRCRPTAYYPSIIIELAERLYIQTAPADPADMSRVAKNLPQILGLLGPSAASCNFINTMRKGSPSYSLVTAFEEAFRTWEGKVAHPPHFSEWRPVNTTSMSLRTEEQGHSFHATIYSPAWTDLVYRSRGNASVSGKVLHTLHWDPLSKAISRVEPILKPYDTYLPPLNSHRAQDAPSNNLDEVHKCMQLHRPEATDDRECGNLEFLCTLNIPSPERMKYLLDLCKEKQTAHRRRTLLETQDLQRIPLSFGEGASHPTDRRGWWVRVLSEELTSKCGK